MARAVHEALRLGFQDDRAHRVLRRRAFRVSTRSSITSAAGGAAIVYGKLTAGNSIVTVELTCPEPACTTVFTGMPVSRAMNTSSVVFGGARWTEEENAPNSPASVPATSVLPSTSSPK